MVKQREGKGKAVVQWFLRGAAVGFYASVGMAVEAVEKARDRLKDRKDKVEAVEESVEAVVEQIRKDYVAAIAEGKQPGHVFLSAPGYGYDGECCVICGEGKEDAGKPCQPGK